jgi:hypothetical protein
MRSFPLVALLLLSVGPVFGQANDQKWRTATEKELRQLIPARAQVEKERIETEFRTAAGITDGRGKFIAGVVMITAGYSAEGKYSHFFITHVPIKCGEVALRPGEYVFGYKRTDQDTLEVKFYEASTAKFLGDVRAHLDSRKGPVRSLVITVAGAEKPAVRIGRFFFEYSITGQ